MDSLNPTGFFHRFTVIQKRLYMGENSFSDALFSCKGISWNAKGKARLFGALHVVEIPP